MNFNAANFNGRQNRISLLESNNTIWSVEDYGYRGGVDFYLNKNHTLGFITSGKFMKGGQ